MSININTDIINIIKELRSEITNLKNRLCIIENTTPAQDCSIFNLIIIKNEKDILIGLNTTNRKIISVIKLNLNQLKILIKLIKKNLTIGKSIISFSDYEMYDKNAYYKNNEWIID